LDGRALSGLLRGKREPARHGRIEGGPRECRLTERHRVISLGSAMAGVRSRDSISRQVLIGSGSAAWLFAQLMFLDP